MAIAEDDWTLHPVWNLTGRRTMGRTANHIVRETESARGWPHFPDEAIAPALFAGAVLGAECVPEHISTPIA